VSYLKIFFEENPVFTVNEFKNAFKEGRSIHTLQTQLKQYTKSGYIKPLRRGVYFVKGPTGSKSSPDEFMFASKLAPDGLIAYHSAFDLLGFGHSVFNSLYYFTSKRQHLLTFNSFRFVPLSYPVELTRKSNEGFGVEKVERLGKKILVTGKERTLVDCLDHPEYAGGFEELYHSAQKMPYLSFELLLKYLTFRARKVLFAKVGFFLEQHRDEFHVEESFLQELERNCPSQPAYWDRTQKENVLKKRWKLIVPSVVNSRKWEEF
jgi:predicted transcriptional regulator of viral defense system